jgi:hypothetical protein
MRRTYRTRIRVFPLHTLLLDADRVATFKASNARLHFGVCCSRTGFLPFLFSVSHSREGVRQKHRFLLLTPQVRRAAERKARKQERKAANDFLFSPEDAVGFRIPESALERLSNDPNRRFRARNELARRILDPTTTSPAQVAANRVNSQLSSGPKTPQGKGTSCLNAVKGRTHRPHCPAPQ